MGGVSAAAASIEPRHTSVTVMASSPGIRGRVLAALAGKPGLELQVFRSAAGLMRAAPDLMVLHCSSLDSAPELIGELRGRFGETSIIIICEYTNAREAQRVVRAGVEGIVLITQLESALAPTVAAVLAGQIVLPRQVGSTHKEPVLSVREKQILGMVVMGFTNSQISAKLFLAESTVKSHLSSAYSKLSVRSRNEAAAMILDPGGRLGTGILAITPEGLKA